MLFLIVGEDAVGARPRVAGERLRKKSVFLARFQVDGGSRDGAGRGVLAKPRSLLGSTVPVLGRALPWPALGEFPLI